MKILRSLTAVILVAAIVFTVFIGKNEITNNGILSAPAEYKGIITLWHIDTFVGGCWADDNAETLNYLAENGHELANHGYFHKDHSALDYEKNKEEIYLTGVIVNALCGKTLTLFAPPSGSYSDITLQAAADLGYQVIMWSKDTIDWRDKDKTKIISRATKNLTGGDLILMHPKAHTLSALPEIVDYCIAHGFEIVKVSENIYRKNTQNT